MCKRIDLLDHYRAGSVANGFAPFNILPAKIRCPRITGRVVHLRLYNVRWLRLSMARHGFELVGSRIRPLPLFSRQGSKIAKGLLGKVVGCVRSYTFHELPDYSPLTSIIPFSMPQSYCPRFWCDVTRTGSKLMSSALIAGNFGRVGM